MENKITRICDSCNSHELEVVNLLHGEYKCKHCGRVTIIETKVSNEIIAILNEADIKRNNGEFDSAAQRYEKVIEKAPNLPNGYWGLFLCEYGIMYVKDPKTGVYKPTCNRLSDIRVLKDANYNKVIELANNEEIESYEQKANEIEHIRQDAITIAKKEKPYEIFICYKKTYDEHEEAYTIESKHANDIYRSLTKKGYKVFFAEEVLKDVVGDKYEPIIYNALTTSSLMLVVTSNKTNVESKWVKNEWGRYLKQMKGNKNKKIIPIVCGGMTLNKLPDDLKKYEGLLMEDYNFQTTLQKTVEKNVVRLNDKRVAKKINITTQTITAKAVNKKAKNIGGSEIKELDLSTERMIELAFNYMEKGAYNIAYQNFNEIYHKNNDNNVAKWGSQFSHFCMKKQKTFENKKIDIRPTLEKALRETNVNIYNLILKSLYDEAIRALSHQEYVLASELYNLAMSWEFENSNKLFEEYNLTILTMISKKVFEYELLIDTILKNNILDANEYIDLLMTYIKRINLSLQSPSIKYFEKDICFRLKIKYANEILKVDPSNTEALWHKLLSQIKTEDTEELINNIHEFNNYALLEEIFAYTTEEEQCKILEFLINTLIKSINRNITDNVKFNKYINIFETLLEYIPESINEKYIDYLYQLASICQKSNKYELAIRYYSSIVTENEKEHKAYWGILQSKLSCKNDIELINNKVSISSIQEFNSTISAVGNDRELLDKYLNIKIRQDKKTTKKKNTRRFLILLFTFFILSLTLGLGSFIYFTHDHDYEDNYCTICKKYLYAENLEYEKIDNYYVVSKYIPTTDNYVKVEIPSTYKNLPVKGIKEYAFGNVKSLETVVMNDNIEYIGYAAFRSCTNLETVILSNDLEQIDKFAFYGCESLKNINIPLSVKEIGSQAFAFCNELKSVEFKNNGKINTATFKSKLETIADSAFSSCASLQSITIPNSVTSIGESAFYNCTSLTNIEIPNSVTSIGNSTFYGCRNLVSITIPNSVTSIGEGIFEECTKLKSLYIPFLNKHLGILFGASQYQQNEAYVPKSLKHVTITSGEISTSAFSNCKSIQTIQLGNHVTKIRSNAFYNCSSLQSIELSQNLTYIGANAFEDCDDLTLINLYDSITFVGANAFKNCNDLTIVCKNVDQISKFDPSWNPNNCEVTYSETYKITFNTDGGEELEDMKVAAGMMVTLPTPQKEGYKFLGWYYNNVKYNSTITMPKNNLTLVAKWEIGTYKIIFNSNGGSSVSSITKQYGESITLPTPTKTGYTFDGWYYNNTKFTQTTMPSENITLTARWKTNKYTITFNSNGGSSVASITKEYGATITLVTPTKTGYTFDGWYYNNTKFTQTTMPSENITLVARWIANKYTITFNSNGGSAVSSITKQYGENITLPTPTKEGYTFDGWYYNNTKFTQTTMPAESITLTAKWTAIQFTITFNSNGGSSVSSITSAYNSVVTLPTPTREGYTFDGWYYNGVKYVVNMIMPNKNIELVAYWITNTYTITFNSNGGSSVSSMSKIYGAYVSLPTPTKEGYTFDGWYYNGVKYTTSITMPNRNIELIAYWKINSYTITFNSNGGSAVSSKTSEYNSTITLPTPTREGYTFDGWYLNGIKYTTSIVVPGRNIELLAYWTANSYNISISTESSSIGNVYFNDGTYKVTFNSNGGTAVSEQYISNKDDLVYPQIPQKSGYIFSGWYRNSSCTTLYDFSSTISSDIILYAGWIRNQGNSQILYVGSTSETLSCPAKNSSFSTDNYYPFISFVTQRITIYSNGSNDTYGYLFDANKNMLYSDDDGGSSYNFSISYTVNAGELYYIVPCGYYSSASLTVTIDGTSTPIASSNANNKKQITANTGQIVKLNAVNEYGYEFIGWYEGTKLISSSQVYNYQVQAKDINLVAKWQKGTYTISLNTDGGNNISPIAKTYGTTFSLPTPTKTGHTFLGWYLNDVKYTQSVMPGENITLTAKWSVNKYTITFDTDGGSSISQLTLEYGAIIPNIPDPTKKNYTFVGWDKTIPQTMPAQNITLKANWVFEAFVYTLSPDRTYYIISGITDKSGTTLTIPSTYKGLPVKEIGTNAIYECSNFTKVVIPSNINKINSWAFTYCSNLKTVIFEGNVTSIGDYAFAYCQNLQNINLPNSLETIGDYTFMCCTALEAITIPQSVTEIGDSAFAYCLSLTITALATTIPTNWHDNWNPDNRKVIWQNLTISVDVYTENGKKYVNLGRYPQTVVTNTTTINALSKITATNSLGYIEYNGKEYKKVVANPYSSGYKFINGNTIIDGNTYYFLVEPIKWRVLEEKDGTYKLLSEMILDNTEFYQSALTRTINGKRIYPNNYEYSNIRAWLNGYDGTSYNVNNYTGIGFYDIGFTEEEKLLINTTPVDNSLASTGNSNNIYICNNTTDKVYLLSVKDVFNTNYGFISSMYSQNSREAVVSDYARSKYCRISTGSSYYGNGEWWLRSPHNNYYDYAYYVYGDGSVYGSNYICNTHNGVRAALTITI